MSYSNGFYFILIAIAAVLSIISYRQGYNKTIFIVVVLIATLLDEITQMIIVQYKIKGYGFTTYIFNVLEYCMYAMYYIKTCGTDHFKFWARFSIPLFILFCIVTFFLKYHFNKYPVLNINVEGALLFIFYTHLLFCLDEGEKKSIYEHGDFWISIGVLVFFGGIFVYLGLFPILMNLDIKQAFQKYRLIAYPLNILFYSSIIIGLLCLIRNKKYLTR